MVPPHDPERTGDAQRGITTGDDTDHHGQCKALYGSDVEHARHHINGQDSRQGGNRGHDRSSHGLGRADVKYRVDADLSAHELSLLTHTVVDDDGIVQRVTQNHQHNGDEVGVNRPAEDYVEEVNHRNVVEQRNQRHHTG